MSEEVLAAERERRRREREERRQDKAAPPPVDAPAPTPPRSRQGGHAARRRPLAVALLGIGVLGVAAVAALAYRHFHRNTPPPVVLKTINVTVPEGYTRAQTARLAKGAGLTGSYVVASKGHEGFLFPDTFELERYAPAADLVQRQLEDFKQRTEGVDLSYARSKNLTLRDVVTIASMIEHEVATEKDRPLVAAVIYNRLHEGMPLGIDATIRFATGNYTRPLTESELAVESPYNTRTHAGLPPGPIDSPGLASIEAAAHPAKVDYLFYVTEPGTCGGLAFAATEAEFEEDAARYNAAREAAGGNSPDTCGE